MVYTYQIHTMKIAELANCICKEQIPIDFIFENCENCQAYGLPCMNCSSMTRNALPPGTVSDGISFPLCKLARRIFPDITRPVLDQCLVCTLHGLPCMGCSHALKGKVGPGHVGNQRTLYGFRDDQEEIAYQIGYLEPSTDGSWYTDSEFVINVNKWMDKNPEAVINQLWIDHNWQENGFTTYP